MIIEKNNIKITSRESAVKFLAGECAVESLKQGLSSHLASAKYGVKPQTMFPFQADYDYAKEVLGSLSAGEEELFNRHFVAVIYAAIDCGEGALCAFVDTFGAHKLGLFFNTYIGKAERFSDFDSLEVSEHETICIGGHWFVFHGDFKNGLTRAQ